MVAPGAAEHFDERLVAYCRELAHGLRRGPAVFTTGDLIIVYLAS